MAATPPTNTQLLTDLTASVARLEGKVDVLQSSINTLGKGGVDEAALIGIVRKALSWP